MKPAQTPDPTSEESNAATWLREQREMTSQLLSNIQQQLPKLDEFLARVESHWCMEDGLYRFYHQSFKVYQLQDTTKAICKALQDLLPDRRMNRWFSEIVAQGAGHAFELSHNQEWLRHTRPILEAFFHAHYFLKMAVKCGKRLNTPPDSLPSGWAAVLHLFDLR